MHEWMTPDQKECYELLCDVFRGEHHLQGKVSEWGHGLKLNRLSSDLSTIDGNELTRLVVAAHDRCVRVSIVSSGPRMIGITLFKRHERTGSISKRHPFIEDAIKDIRNGRPLF